MGAAPPASFTDNPPMELVEVFPTESKRQAAMRETVGWISFAVLTSLADTPTKQENVVTLLSNFRCYMLYHIKAAKSTLHATMRSKIAGWLEGTRVGVTVRQAEVGLCLLSCRAAARRPFFSCRIFVFTMCVWLQFCMPPSQTIHIPRRRRNCRAARSSGVLCKAI